MEISWRRLLSWSVLAVLVMSLAVGGCGTMKKWVGGGSEDEPEEEVDLRPPELAEETVLVDGKTYIRSKNPYYLTYPNQPEYIYAEKGTEFVGLQDYLFQRLAKAMGKDKKGAVPKEKIQEMVRAEVERILREQGMGGAVYASRSPSTSPYPGRAVAVIPALSETPRQYEGLNLALANSLRADLKRAKDIVVIDEGPTKEALAKAVSGGKLATRRNLEALGDALGVQGVIITQIIPPGRDPSAYMATELYDTFLGTQIKSLVEPVTSADLNVDTANKVGRKEAMQMANEIRSLDWFGRIEFIKDNKIFLNLGNNTGLKVGSLLKVVSPGKEIINPNTQASLGYTADIPQGEIKVTDIIGTNAAAATVISGGPFKPNEKVKAGI